MRPFLTFTLILLAVAMTVSTIRHVSGSLFRKAPPGYSTPAQARPAGWWV